MCTVQLIGEVFCQIAQNWFQKKRETEQNFTLVIASDYTDDILTTALSRISEIMKRSKLKSRESGGNRAIKYLTDEHAM